MHERYAPGDVIRVLNRTENMRTNSKVRLNASL